MIERLGPYLFILETPEIKAFPPKNKGKHVHLHVLSIPRHPVIPPEVRCLIGMFLGSKYGNLRNVALGCLGYLSENMSSETSRLRNGTS